jgi:XTP/dITP diphosphohydrolase
MRLVFATGNKGKLREASEILGDEFELLSSAQAGVTEDVEETGLTLKDNSIIKAEYIFSKTGLDCFADDTGLEVDALGGAPGVFTARYAGEGCNFDDNIRKLLAELAALDAASAGTPVPRTARFRSVVTLIIGGEKHFFEGVMEGKIALEKAGCGGFGYDPVFIADEYPDQTVAELPEETKNAISHRGRALRAMAAWLRTSAK